MALTKVDDRGLKTPIDLQDNEKIRLGTGNDLEIFHDGSNSYINDNGTGNLIVTGQLDVNGNVALDDNHKFIAGSNSDLQVYHDGSNSYLKAISGGTGDLYVFADSKTIYLRPKSGEDGIKVIPDGAVELYNNGAKKLETYASGAKISSSAHTYLEIQSATNSSAVIHLGDTDNSDEAQIWYDNYAGGLYLRTSTNTPMVFYTNGTERLRIANDGKVSVGASPIYNFNVRGSGQQTLLVGSTDAGGAYLTLDGDSGGDGQGGDYCSIGHTTAGNLEIIADNPSGNANVIIKAGNAAEKMRIDSAGNVGIGNDASFPVYTHANARNFIIGHGGESTALQIHSSSTTYGGIYFGDVADRTDANSYIGSIEYKHGDDYMNFRTNGSERMRIASDGKIGIGYTSPDAPLHVQAPNVSGELSPALMLTHNSYSVNGGASIVFKTDHSSYTTWKYAEIGAAYTRSNYGGDLVFKTNFGGSATNLTEKLRIRNDGGISFNGDTAAANFLDDYEEGTFTPAAANSVTLHTSQDLCRYTKIGRQVTVSGQVRINSDNSNSDFALTGLPFANLSGSEGSSSTIGAVRLWDYDLPADTLDVVCLIDSNEAVVYFWRNRDNAGAERLDADSNAYVAFTITYFTS